MAVIRKKGSNNVPAISTASLPDVIFMILFFFMTTTSMKETELRVSVSLPSATEIQKLEKKSLVSYIYVGQPLKKYQAKDGTAPRIQLNDSYCTPRDINEFISSERDKLSESDRNSMSVCIKADKYTKMGIITDIKTELRKANALKITYAATQQQGYY